jgi:predicted dehydrogenase
MRNKINIGVVGCGAHAQIAHLPAFRKNPDCNLIAICDTDIRKIDHLGSKYSIPYRYQDFSEMLRNSDIDALVISTPNYLHAPMAISALEYGKHVLCDVPMATSLREAQDVVKIAKKAKARLAMAFSDRFRPDVQTLKKFIKEGELGDIYYVKSGWLIGSKNWILNPWRQEYLKSGGGAFLSLGVNLLDLAIYLLEDKRMSTIFASIHKKNPGATVEDTAMCIINYTDGTLLTIEVSWSLIFDRDFLYCNIFGKKGAALLNPLKIQKELHNELVNVAPTFPPKNLYKVSYDLQVQFFLDSLRKNAVPPFGFEDGLTIARITDAFYESARKQKLIKI